MVAIDLDFIRSLNCPTTIANYFEDVIFWLGHAVTWLKDKILDWIATIYAMAVDFFQNCFSLMNHCEQLPQTVVKRRFQTAVEVYKTLPRDPQGIINKFLGKNYKKILKRAELGDDLLRKLKEHGNSVQDLDIPTDYSYPLLLDTLSFFPKLESLRIYQKLDAERLQNIAKRLPPKLQKLRLILYGSKEEFDLISQFRHLVSLEIGAILRRTTQGHFERLATLEKLEELKLCGEISDTILDQLKFFPKLKKLTLEYCGLDLEGDPEDITVDLKKLAKLPRLRFLKLNNGRWIKENDVWQLQNMRPRLNLQI